MKPMTVESLARRRIQLVLFNMDHKITQKMTEITIQSYIPCNHNKVIPQYIANQFKQLASNNNSITPAQMKTMRAATDILNKAYRARQS